MMQNDIVLDVNVCVEVWDQDFRGNWLLNRGASRWMHNMITQNGFNLVRDRLSGVVGANPLSHFGIGVVDTAPAISDNVLYNEVFRDVITGLDEDDGLLTVSYFLGTGSANGGTLKEVGLFNAATAGTLFARAILSPAIVKDVTRQVTFTWRIGFNTGVLTVTINRYIGYVVTLGGDAAQYSYQTAYPTGGTVDKLVPEGEVWLMLPSDLPIGTFAIECMMKTNHASGQGTVALFNLDDAPDTALSGSAVTGTVGQLTGELIRSTAITFGAPVSSKRWGVKVKSNNTLYGIAVWGVRVIQIS